MKLLELDRKFLLHKKIAKQGNIMEPITTKIPFVLFNTDIPYPEQNSQLINTTITIKYRDRTVADKEAYFVHSAGRPYDDEPYSEPGEEVRENILYTKNFFVLRADNVEPYKFIGISDDYRYIIVGDLNEDGTFKSDPVAAIQVTEYIGIVVKDKHNRSGVVLSMDAGEPHNTVVMEYLEDDNIRFMLGSEIEFEVTGYTDLDNVIHMMSTYDDFRNYDINRTDLQIASLRKHLLSSFINRATQITEEESE